MKVVVVLVLLGMLGCTPFDVAKSLLDPSSGPSLDVTVGDKEEAVVGQVGDSSEIEAESITGGVNTTNIQETPPWVVLLLVIGWVLPGPREMYAEVKSWFKRK